MSDFLSRLGARQMSEPAIRPRTVSRFESAVVSPHPFRPENFSSDSVDASLRANSAEPAFAERTENNRSIGTRGSEQQPNSTSIANQTRDAHASQDIDIEQRLRDLLNGVEQMAAERQRVDAPARGYNSVEPIASTLRGNNESGLRRDSVNASTTVFTNIAPHVEAIPTIKSQRDVAEFDIGATPREPDVVHVHIGRVEVRAVHAAPERTRTRNQTGADNARPLSLEKYLGAKERQ